MTFTLVSRQVLLALLQSRLPSIEASCETLLISAGLFNNREAFKVLIRAGIDTNWLNEEVRGHELLFYAAEINCADIVEVLLARGCRADTGLAVYQSQTAITIAILKGNLDCAKLLIQNCDVNRELPPPWITTNFSSFIEIFGGTKLDHHRCLDIFLQQGADVDYQMQPVILVMSKKHQFRLEPMHHFHPSCQPSILDYVFYFYRPLFSKLIMSGKDLSQFSRARALLHLEEGISVLQKYLKMDLTPPNDLNGLGWKDRALGILLLEQLRLSTSRPDDEIYWSRALQFIELEVDLTWLSENETAKMRCAAARLTTSGGKSKGRARLANTARAFGSRLQGSSRCVVSCC